MNRLDFRHATLPFALLLALATGCDDAEPDPAESETTEPTEVAAAPPATPEPSTPEGWEEVEVQVQGHPITTLAPTAEQDLDVADHGTGVYGSLPGQDYPYNHYLRYHEEAPELRMLLNKPGLEKVDNDHGYTAELRAEDGNDWSYVVYDSRSHVSCIVSANSSRGVSDALVTEARRACDQFAE
ncbi:MAG: hypothetical protein CMN30_33675 [Sandaracinus sp.]|nr:hypothetical protein [Sandaracinus sp.]|tara:strand:+ start:522 stop:1073 length:552 start_codon:yes stop_codon:yes gene_type:complete